MAPRLAKLVEQATADCTAGSVEKWRRWTGLRPEGFVPPQSIPAIAHSLGISRAAVSKPALQVAVRVLQLIAQSHPYTDDEHADVMRLVDRSRY